MRTHAIVLLTMMALVGCGRAPVEEDVAVKVPFEPHACCANPNRGQHFVAFQGTDRNDWPMFGGTPARNMVNPTARNIPAEWSVEEGQNLKWSAELGTKTYGGPVIADGKVYVGTNNLRPRDPKVKGSRAVLMCFAEADGKFLWQQAYDMPTGEIFNEVKDMGLLSTPAVDSGKLYFVLPGTEVVCADAATGKSLWQFDMMKELKVVPFHCANCSPVAVGKHVFVITGNGTNAEGKLVNPKAPSFLALDKETGKVAWTSDLPGTGIIEGQWSNPTYAEINGKPQVIFAGGDAVLYSLEPDTGKLIWKFNCRPKKKADAEEDDDASKIYIVATPVVYDNKVYVSLGLYPENAIGPRFSHVLCIDATRTGDVSPGTTLDPKAADNKNSALVWAFGGTIEPRPKKGRSIFFGRSISTCAIHDGLVYVPEEYGYLHCIDAKTGQRYWEHDLKAGIWGSAYVADNKVFLGTEEGEVVVYKPGKELKVLHRNELGELTHGTPVVANNVLYVTTRSKLFAIAEKK